MSDALEACSGMDPNDVMEMKSIDGPPATRPSEHVEAPRGRSRNESVASIIEDVVGCKWTLHILGQIRHGVVRPGALQRSVAGLTTKVLNQRLRKLVGYGLLEKHALGTRSLHVEYHLTPFGQQIDAILEQIDALQHERDDRARLP